MARERSSVRVGMPATTEGYRTGSTGVNAPPDAGRVGRGGEPVEGPGKGPRRGARFLESFLPAGKKSIWKPKE